MNKTIIPIKGMHCRSCEILIEEKLKEFPDIKSAQVNYKKKQATIYSRQPLDINQIKSAVIEAGYEVGEDDSKSWISRDPEEYKDFGISLVVLFIVYFIAIKLGLFNISTGSGGNPSNLFVVLLIGLTAGISTCMALVGGLVLGISARHSEKHPEATPAQKFRPHLYFNLGRIISYFLLGGLIGLIGKAFQLNGPTLGALTIIVGVIMLIMGAQLTGMFPKLSGGGLTLPSSISKLLGTKKHHEKEYSHGNSMLVGALTFFLPCGFTQAMQLYAMSTGSFWSGSLIMGIFAIGTAPGLLGIGGFTSVIKGAFARKFFKFTGLLVIFLAIFNISNGYNLTGWQIASSLKDNPAAIKSDPNVKIENGIQTVRMTQTATGYKPNRFTITAGIPTKWIINSKESGSCASSILVPKLNIRKSLSAGENIIEFTPNQVGEIKFTCAMGMYSGKLTVVKNDKVSQEDNKPVAATDSPEIETDPQAPPKQDTAIFPPQNQPSKPKAPAPPKQEEPRKDTTVQIIKTTYLSAEEDISPNYYTVSAGRPVRFEVDVKEDGTGCMSTIMIPGLADDPVLLEKGKTITFEFTPKSGFYDITCAMGVPRGILYIE